MNCKTLLVVQTALDMLLPSDRLKALALRSGGLNSRMSGFLKRADKRLQV